MINVEKEIIRKFPKLEKNMKFLSKPIIKMVSSLIKENAINDFMAKNEHLKGFEFIDAVLEYFSFDFMIKNSQLQNIPSSGRVVIISNHPLGGLDALVLLKLVGKVRPDVKIVANDFLNQFKNLQSLFLHIDNFKPRQAKQDIKAIYEALNEDRAVIIFPAGEVSRLTKTGVKDKLWHKGFLNFASATNSPILPIFVDAKNSKTFYTMSIINKTFSTLMLSSEMFKKESKTVNIKIGKLIPNENITPKGFDKSFLITLYKKHLYALKNGKKSYFDTEEAIAHPEDRQLIYKELKKSQRIGSTFDNKEIYLYKNDSDSVILNEIGRLREISFRRVGEGINKSKDLDKYDKYYEHIILWDKEDLEIVGSYRIGNAKDIYEKFGIKGFYTNTLFEFSEELENYLEDSIELGRSFVQPKYWGTRALDYLWFGIGAYLKNNPQIKYMFGPVSLSNSYPTIAKELIVHYYSHYYGRHDNVVIPRLPFKYQSKLEDIDTLFDFQNMKDDFKILKKLLANLDVTIPTLYKQYTDICEEGGASFLGFNVDIDFSNCIDGMIFVEVDKIKDKQKQRYIK